MYCVNLQIIPAPAQVPEWMKIVSIPARPGEGAEAACDRCGGSGHFKHEPCRSCNATGKAVYVQAVRCEVAEANRPEAAALLDALLTDIAPSRVRIQTTIRFQEMGGGSTNTGHARIISGLDGQPLVSVWGQTHCNGTHAQFFAHAALVVNYSQHRGQGGGIITFVGVDRGSAHHLGVDQVDLWRFADGEDAMECLSPRVRDFDIPLAAVKAAHDKARCYHCRSAYFAKGRTAAGPDGALTGAGAAFGGEPSPFKGPGKGY